MSPKQEQSRAWKEFVEEFAQMAEDLGANRVGGYTLDELDAATRRVWS